MKYEKFEEWMLGKKVTHVYAEYSGVIVERPAEDDPYITVRVKYDEGCLAGDTVGAWLRNLEFLEEKPSEEVGAQENSQIDWQVGQVVWDVRNGRGVVKEIGDNEYYPIYVEFDLTDRYGDAVTDVYTVDGRYVDTQKNRSLFFSEPVITAELFPPKKPFVPTLKKGDTVLVLTDSSEKAQVVVEETEEMLYTVLTDYKKSEITRVYKIGEEIKFQ